MEQPSLFSSDPSPRAQDRAHCPLAVRMRPRQLKEMVGHPSILGEGALLPKLIANDTFGSLLFYGPPGCGKTTLSEVITHETKSPCVHLNAVSSNVAELREVLKMARYQPAKRTVLLIDEIHRFNKAQQDLLLPDVEAGTVRLIGATTHNPGFYLIPPLLSRSHLFRLEPLPEQAIIAMLEQALQDPGRGLGATRCQANPEVLRGLAQLCDGDLRRALNALETLVLGMPIGHSITEKDLETFARERRIRYDANEDEHYDTASAFIKSVRGSDPDAALYWMTKMLEGGEDPRFIARRLVILASEDIGLADSRALPLATATLQAVDFVGMPEAALNLSHCTLFLTLCPKSNSATEALERARKALKNLPVQSVPPWLRDSHHPVAKQLGYGKDYRYSHNEPDGISGQAYLNSPLELYKPKMAGAEATLAERLKQWQHIRKERANPDKTTE